MLQSVTSCLAMFALLINPTAPIGDVFVDINAAGCTTGTGSATDPTCSISAAINLASSGDTIRIAPGTYVENLTVGFDLALIGIDGDSVTIVSGVPFSNQSVVTVQTGVALTIDGLTIRDGRSLGDGGGIRVDGDLVLRNSTVRNNRNFGFSALGGYPCGGGIGAVNPGSTIVIDQSLICDNYSFGDGGGLGVRGANLTIRNSSITRNRAHALCDGGGLFTGGAGLAPASRVSLINTTIAQNDAGFAGAMYLGTQPGSSLENVSVEGQIVHAGGAANLEVHNTIFSPGALMPASYYPLQGNFTSLGNNLIAEAGAYSSGFANGVNGDLVGSTLNPLDPLFGPLQNNGGRTETLALLAGSPAINTGDVTHFELLDQRGVHRPQGGTSDIGAFEFGGAFSDSCNGDGGNQMACTDCPCANNSTAGSVGGCLNSAGLAARLGVAGSSSVTLPPLISADLRFDLEGAPAFAFCVLCSGDGIAPESAANPCFGMGSGVQALAFDGLRCAVTNTRRHGGRVADSSGAVGQTSNAWGGEGGPGVGLAVAFGGFAVGQTRFFQTIYRDDPSVVCMRGLNTTQAIEIVFTP